MIIFLKKKEEKKDILGTLLLVGIKDLDKM